MTLLAAGLQGYLVGVGSLNTDPLALVSRALLIAGGLLLAFPELYSNGIGLILLIHRFITR
ncbi:MAG: hypothetical protein IIA40_10415 [SAR324 cluster bacterium]|nr:hypothetical protein [SAR324 cluster bacterium]